MRVLAVGAAVAAVALVVNSNGAAASTSGPGGCQWQSGFICPGPWPVSAAVGQVDALAHTVR